MFTDHEHTNTIWWPYDFITIVSLRLLITIWWPYDLITIVFRVLDEAVQEKSMLKRFEDQALQMQA